MNLLQALFWFVLGMNLVLFVWGMRAGRRGAWINGMAVFFMASSEILVRAAVAGRL